MFLAVVRPLLEYAATVWEPHQQRIQKLNCPPHVVLRIGLKVTRICSSVLIYQLYSKEEIFSKSVSLPS